MPCLPMIQLPMIPTCGGCGKRKKRDVNATQVVTSSESSCTDPELRKLILKNMQNNILKSRNAIARAANSHFNGTAEFIAFCMPGRMENFVTSMASFCVDGSPSQSCYLFKSD
ncbi:hypothetical protein L596_004796 [Steinernema carpocapsae]|uniref:Ground-like domain-containing protein n=1 Tax=Steinernema carpocapsae TaxID=34508 RepID=A0A4U8V0H4_STECR|nr:hypothetical protein L596_004796 [Steinernema carpocapsae]